MRKIDGKRGDLMQVGDKVIICDRLYFDGFIGEVEIIGASHVTVKLKDKRRDCSIKFWRSQVSKLNIEGADSE